MGQPRDLAPVERILSGIRPEAEALLDGIDEGRDPAELASEFGVACERVALEVLATQPGAAITVEDFAVVAGTTGLEEFRRLHGEIFLVHTGARGELSVAGGARDPTLVPSRSSETGLALQRRPVYGLAFEGDVSRVGRAEQGNQLVLPYSSVSQHHALFHRSPEGRLELGDLGSHNGTFVNGRPICQGERARVRWGDRIHLGGVAFIVLGVEQLFELITSLGAGE
jgi:hypothetical protein